MTTVQKFMFDTRFDVSEIVEPKLSDQVADDDEYVAVPPATYSDEDLNAARQEGFEAGKRDGYEAAASSTEDKTLSVLQSVNERFAEVTAAQRKANEEIAQASISVAASIMSKMMPALSEKHGLDEIVAVVEKAIVHLQTEPHITVKVAEHLAEAVRERVSQLASAHGSMGEITVVGDPEILDGDCQLMWSNGEAVRSAADLQNCVEEIVRRYSDPTVQEGDAITPDLPGDDSTAGQGSADVGAAAETPTSDDPTQISGEVIGPEAQPEDSSRYAEPQPLGNDDAAARTPVDDGPDVEPSESAEPAEAVSTDLNDDSQIEDRSPAVGTMDFESADDGGTPPKTP